MVGPESGEWLAGANKGEVTRKRILDRALRLASYRGFEGISFGDLASDLQLSKSGLFAHFKSKQRLQLDVLALAADHFRSAVFVPALRRPRGRPRLSAVFRGWMDWIRDDESCAGCVFLSGAAEWDDREGLVRDSLVRFFDELQRALARTVTMAIEEGHFKADLQVDPFVSDMHALVLKYHLDARLLRKRLARNHARKAFERLCESASR